MANSATYTYVLKGKQFRKALLSNVGDSIETELFNMAGLKWAIICYPNGCHSTRKGIFHVCLALREMPSHFKHILVQLRMECIELSASWTSIIKYHHPHHTRIQGWSEASATFEELKTTKKKQISFKINIKIVRIISIKNKLLFADLLPIKSGSTNKIQWKIDKYNYIKHFKHFKHYEKQLESQLKNDSILILRCIPNTSDCIPEYKGYVSVILQLVHLALGDSYKLRIKWTLKCFEMDIMCSQIDTLSVEDSNCGPLNFCRLNKLIRKTKSFKNITIHATYEILDIFDKNNKKISKTRWNKNNIKYNYKKCFQTRNTPQYDLYSVGSNEWGQQGNGDGGYNNINQITKIKTFNKTIKNIISGWHFVYIVFTGNTYQYQCCGKNDFGQLGIKQFNEKNNTLGEIDINIKIKNIFASPYFNASRAFCISKSNKLYAVGSNDVNQFGIKTQYLYYNKWTHINSSLLSVTIKKVATSNCYTTFLSTNGKIYVSGLGILGLGTNIQRTKHFMPIKTKARFKDICCGWRHTLAIDNNGIVWAWGYNGFGQLGMGDTNARYVPTILQYFSKNININIAKMCCGWGHSIVLTKNKIYLFGKNDDYECGNGSDDNVLLPQSNQTLQNKDIVDIKCGTSHNVIKTKKKEYYLWGNNLYHECLVYGKVESVRIPTKYNENEFKENNMKIVAIYPGCNETRIIATKMIKCEWKLCKKYEKEFDRKNKCKGCKLVRYCSKRHQKMDWNDIHRQQCSKYSIC